MSDRDEIKNRVKAAINLAEWIGREIELKRTGENEYKALCPFHAESSPSFSVACKDGAWFFHCFGCEASGDIFEWIMRRKGLGFPDALKLAANAVNISLPDDRFYKHPMGGKTAPDLGAFDPEKYRALVPDGKVWNYLTQQRKLDGGLLADYAVGETADGEAYAFAYKWRPKGWPDNRAPKFEFAKVVKVDRVDGKKEEWRDPKGGKNILFGMSSPKVVEAFKAGGELVICEGELDAISWAQFGFAAVSVPGGAKYTGWIDLCWEWLQTFKKIYVSFDEDATGRLKIVEVVTRLGMSRTDIVRLPFVAEGKRFKDANECLQAGMAAAEIASCVANPEVLRPEKLKDIYDFEEAIWEKFHPSGKASIGLTLPWGNFHGSSLPFRFRRGEVTVWSGYNKHGKSEVLNNVIIHLCWQGDRALVCSLEVQAPETYRKLIRMVQAKRDVCAPEERAQFRERCLEPLAKRVWVYDHVGNASVEDVLNVMLYAYQRYGCRQFVLDSLMKFERLDGEGQEQWNQQRDFMNQLCEFAGRYMVHVHLVAHSRKPEKGSEANIPRRYNINGSAYISNLPHNVIIVWRNRHKQDKLEEIFQVATDAWIKHRPTEKMPQWKRLLGGPPSKTAVPHLQELWAKMINVIEHDIPKDMAGQAVNLTAPGRKRFFQMYEQRMSSLITHPLFDYKVSYRRALELQARLLAKTLTGEIAEYVPLLTR